MAIIIKTPDPVGLLKNIHKAFDSDDTRPRTWIRDASREFTHKPMQWYNEAFFDAVKPKKDDKELKFSFVTYDSEDRLKTNEEVYPYYHGRFVEMLVAYFGEEATQIIVTPTPDAIDDLAE